MRLFIALPLTSEVESKLRSIEDEFRQFGGNIKWVAPQNIHLTVRFLGETDERMIDKLSAMMNEIAPKYPSVTTTIDRLGGFPNLRRPRVIWAGLNESDEVAGLEKLAREVELAVRRLRFEKEKKGFRPHLTLARVRDARGAEQLLDHLAAYELEPIPLTLDRLVLFKSTLTPKGPIYERLYEAMLGEARLEG